MDGIIENSRTFWDRHAQRDPLWAILSEPSKEGGTWDAERFFQTGAAEVASLFYQLDSHSIAMRCSAALDFGCGVGRLTQALGPHFDRVVGVDVSPKMVALARKMNRLPQTVSYTSNQAADLRVLDDAEFDFIVSNIVLQHIRPEITLEYLAEFFRVLAPGGVLVFQLPSHERGLKDGPAPPPARAMPDDAYRASLVVRGTPSVALRPAAEVTLEVEVTNRGVVEWSQQAFGIIKVGNHWLDAAGDRMVRRDDGRTALPGSLRPGETGLLPLTITAPAEEGQYQCEVDLAHEGVLWFHDRGSPVVRFTVHVSLQAPPAATAMPDAAYRASLVVTAIPRVALRPAAEVTLEVEVTNRSAIEWSQQAFGAISVGDHWVDEDGDRMLRRDDGRTRLPEPLRPGDTCRLPLTITAPADEGQYQCEIDLAHEGVVWFRDKGSPAVRFTVHVGRQDDVGHGLGREAPVAPARQASQAIAAPSRPSAEVPDVGAMEEPISDQEDFPMHGVHRDTVVALIARHGATLHHVEEDRSCGQDWVSFRYFVSQRA